jgi:hypothetical protein
VHVSQRQPVSSCRKVKGKLLDAREERAARRAEKPTGTQPEEAEHLALALEHISRIK